MNKNHMKQIRKTNKKEQTKYTLLESIIKNFERRNLSFAFNKWADPSSKEESGNIFIDDYNSKKNKNHLKFYENDQEESTKGNYEYFSNDRILGNEFRKQRKEYVIQYGNNSIKRISTENKNNMKGSFASLTNNRIENIYKKKEILRSKINRNNVPIPYRIKLNDIQYYNITDPDVKKEYGIQKAKSPLLNINDEGEIKKEIFEFDEFDNDFDFGSEVKVRNKTKNKNKKNNNNKYEIKFMSINAQNEPKLGLNNIKNKNYSEIGKKSGVNKFMKLFSSDRIIYQNDYEMKNNIDLTSLKNVINKMEMKLINFSKKYFDKWHKESNKYEKEKYEDTDAYKINYINNINEKQKETLYMSADKPKKSNHFKKQKKPIKAITTPFGEQNRTYEDVNYPYLQKNEIKPFNLKRYKKQKNMIYGQENNLFDSKETTTPFGTELNIINNKPLQKSQDLKLKVKKKKRYTKKEEANLITINPMEPPTNDLKEYKINSRSNDNLANSNEFVPFKIKNYYNRTIDNSFVNKYFKTRAINYAKEDINPDVIDIQIKQEKDTESERIDNLTKTIKMGLHLLRKVIRSFQKRITKGNPKDLLKIYFNKWRRINIKMPPILNTEIYSFDKEKEEIYNTNLKTEPIYNSSYKKNYNNINLVKRLKNFNKKDYNENYNPQIESKTEKKDLKYVFDTYDNNKKNIITMNLETPNSARGSSDDKRNLKANKSNKNRNKLAKNKNGNDNDNNILSHSYDIITQKENKIPRSNKKSKAKNKIYKIIIKLNKKKEENLLYKYLIPWYDMTFNTYDYIPYKNNYKNKEEKSKKNLTRNSHDKIRNINNSINSEEEENRLSIRNIEVTINNKYSKKHSVEKRGDTKKYLKAYRENKRKKENDKYRSELTELKKEIKKSMLINNNLLNLVKLNGNWSRGLSSINNYLKLIKSQNKLLSAYQIYSLYEINNNNHYIKLKRYYFYKWLNHNTIFKNTIKQENHIKSKNNHCINCNCNKFYLNCIDCHCTKIKSALKKILIRHVYMKKINLRKYYLYLWYKKSFKTIRQIF